MSQVVVGVDESEGAAEALRWAAREGDLHGWSVTAVMAWGWLDQHHSAREVRFEADYDRRHAEAALDDIVEAALRGGSEAGSIERRVVCDLPARALLDASEGAELLVVAARGTGGFRGLLLGSVSQHCLHHASSPVAIVRHDAGRVAGGMARSQRVVVAVDGSDAALRALRWGLDEAMRRDATLEVVNAWSAPYGGYPLGGVAIDPDVYEDASREVLKDAVAQVSPAQPERIKEVSARGQAASTILDLAEGAEIGRAHV